MLFTIREKLVFFRLVILLVVSLVEKAQEVIDQDEADQLFLGLGERAVGDRHHSVPNPHRLRGLALLEGRRDEVVTALSKHVVVGEGLVDQDLHIALAQGVQRLLFTVDEAQVLHDSNLLRMAIRSIDRSKGARLDVSSTGAAKRFAFEGQVAAMVSSRGALSCMRRSRC